MADGGLLLVFRGQSTEDLLALRDKLMASLSSLGTFSSQAIGGKSYTRDLRFLQSQLEAIQFVLNERTAPYEGTVITDFSQIEGPKKGQPAGTIDVLSD
jgi:hypothetical protein